MFWWGAGHVKVRTFLITICLIEEPSTGFGFSYDDVKKGGNGYLPFSLQYDDYTATFARPVSVAGGDPIKTLTF